MQVLLKGQSGEKNRAAVKRKTTHNLKFRKTADSNEKG
jgi:hypothetical protein